MSFDVDVAKRLGEADIRLAFASSSGITALFGSSGVGKTSLLNMVAGLLRPDRGRIVVAGETVFGDGVDLPPERRGAGYVFQDGRLFPHLRVRANLRYGMREGGWMGYDEAVGFLGIGDLLDRWPRTLSGGEAQRVAIGRALLSGPRFLLMDEPLASLDSARAEEIMRVIERIRDELALPILYVSHNRAEVDRLATTVIEMHR
jgi:molybdate transport system ATP-binding protein